MWYRGRYQFWKTNWRNPAGKCTTQNSFTVPEIASRRTLLADIVTAGTHGVKWKCHTKVKHGFKAAALFFVFYMWGEHTFTLPDFHDDFHGSALAHASLAVLQALDCAVGGCWRAEVGVWGGGGRTKGRVKGRRKKEEKGETVTR